MNEEQKQIDLRENHIWSTSQDGARQAYKRRFEREPVYVEQAPPYYWAAGPVPAEGEGA